MSEQDNSKDGNVDSQHSLYMLFLLVLVFFIMGLGGFLICHILKKKGYRCRTFSDDLDSDNKESLTQLEDDYDEDINDDTVEKIVKCIIQNEANVEVLKEMLKDGNVDLPLPIPVPVPGPVPVPVPVPLPSSLCPRRTSQEGGVSHHHTVHLGSTRAPCILCSQKKRHSLHRQGRSKEGKGRHPGETTVFSVGRFHVTHIEKKNVSQDSQEDSLPNSKQDLGSVDVDQETQRKETLQWENGVVPVDDFPLEDSQSEKGQNDEPTQGECLLHTTVNLDVPMNGPDRKDSKELPKTGSLQEESLLGTITSNTSDQKSLGLAEHLVSKALEEKERLGMKADISGEGIHKASNEASDNQFLQGGSRLDLSGNGMNRPTNIEYEEQSSVVQDPRVSV